MRTDQQVVTLSLEDPATGVVYDLGEWDKMEGGGVDSEEKTYTAARGVKKSLGGQVTVDNIVLSRDYDLARDHAKIGVLIALVGRGIGTISKAPTDSSYAVDISSGGALGYIGTLKRCTPPEVDSESNDAAMVELEFTIPNAPTQA